jgi:predicted secreted protein
MTEVARKTHGTELYRGETKVARLLNISPPEVTRDDMDVTDHDSPDGYKEYIPGLKDGGEVSIEGHLIPTDDTQKGLLAALDIDEPEEWTIRFPTVPVLRIRFNGYVKSYKVGDAPVDGTLIFNATIKVTGKSEILTDESAGLSALVLTGSDSGALDLTPPFDNEVTEYFATAANPDETVTVTPTAEDHTITVNGATVPTGVESGPIALTAEVMNTITVKAAETGAAPVTYVIKVYREGAL